VIFGVILHYLYNFLVIFRREEYIDLITFGETPRQMFVELMGPLQGLELEWAAQGAAPDEMDLTAFDWDYVRVVDCGANMGIYGGLASQLVEETSEYRIERDALGRTSKLIKSAGTLSLPLDYPVHDWNSWQRLKPLYIFYEDRIDWEKVERAKRFQSEGGLIVANIPGGYDTPRELMGDAAACMAFYDHPELIRDILGTLSDTAVKVLERISDVLVIDQLSVHEDLAGKSGPLVGPRQVSEFIQPYFRTVWDLLSARGTRIFEMDTDGNVEAVIAAFLDCGLTSMYPMEPAAGMDVVSLRQKYGQRLAMRGGIDKHVLRQDKKAIRKELEYKMQPIMCQGGMVFGLDHRIPNGTPLENYRFYVDLGREILNLPPRRTDHKGWARMAF
jgi:hypothetical protein